MRTKEEGRVKRKKRIRKNMNGTAERPRLSVFRSGKHIYAQIVDDLGGQTLATASTLHKDVRGDKRTKVDDAKAVGQAIAVAAKQKGIEKVVFDRNGFLYHGRVKALADAAREAGLNF
jgi:large subunit ribosomal protein L18